MAKTFRDLLTELNITERFSDEAQLQSLTEWCSKNISTDMVYTGTPKEQYAAYIELAQTYLDKFLPKTVDLKTKSPVLNHMTAIQYAAKMGYDRFIASLDSKDPSIFNQQTSAGMTPIHLAALEGHLASATELLKLGAALNLANAKLEFPIYSALVLPQKHDEKLKERKKALYSLFAENAEFSITAVDKLGQNIMHLMVIHGYDDLLKDLLARCEHLAFQANNSKEFPIHMAILNRQLNAIQQLLQIKGMDAVGDKNKRNALHYAVIYGNPEIVSVCCQQSTDLDAKDNDGMTALMIAAKEGNLSAFQDLIQKGAAPLLIDGFGKNILHYAVESERSDLVAWILENTKIDLNSEDGEGKTALYYAQNSESFNDNSQIEALLVAKGATNPDNNLLTN